MLKPGLYEQVMNEATREELDRRTDLEAGVAPIDRAEASSILAQYLARHIDQSLSTLAEGSGGILAQVDLANKIIRLIAEEAGEQFSSSLKVADSAEQLFSLFRKQASREGFDRPPVRPETSLSRSSLLTGAAHEPGMYTELKKEIATSDRIDLLISFIKWSGLRMIMDELQAFVDRGGLLRVITTSYMGSTDLKAVHELSKLSPANSQIRISYDTERTRLHAKAYIFYRNTGYSVAYIGSSNLSRPAISSGLEWNVKVTRQDLPETIKKIEATFDNYWNSSEFEFYDNAQYERLAAALKRAATGGPDPLQPYLFEITPYPFQQEILDNLEAERIIHNRWRNLVVAATGTGKTVVSAFDYKRFLKENGTSGSNLLFIAHREEILRQSLACFRGVLKDPNFGDLYVGQYRGTQNTHLFMSIQSFNSSDWSQTTPADYYDYIVVDEFHHAAAPSYRKLLEYYQPKILLGLTATPERMDGKNVVEYFDDRIASEIRLTEAIDRRLLSPFQYFGVADTVDLTTVRWTRGGYDRDELSNIYTLDRAAAEKRASMIIRSIDRYVTDINAVIGLGFCVSVAHAEFMAAFFNQHNIPSLALTGTSDKNARSLAQSRLVSGELRFIFVVDLYNEGVDIPEVNTILFLRPTESLTVFLQQLGRGLRLADNKDCLTVLDFIGQSHQRYNFEEKFESLLTNTRKGLRAELEKGFVSLPRGSYIKLEKQAQAHILANIKVSFNSVRGLVQKLRYLAEDTGSDVSLRDLLEHHHLNPKKVYRRRTFERLAVLAGLKEEFSDPLEDTIRKGLQKVCDIDSHQWIEFIQDIFEDPERLVSEELSETQQRMLGMFRYTMWPNGLASCGFSSDYEAVRYLQASRFYPELRDLLAYNYDRIDFVDKPLQVSETTPLALHCRYTMRQIQMALGFEAPRTHQEGVYYHKEKDTDIFFVTLNKSDKDYSPTTMYDDYSINEELFHWQSQNTTDENSAKGRRYIHHRKNGGRVMFFVREYKQEYGDTAPYTLLGFADYVRHEGSKPMSIIWKLHDPIPAKFLKKTNKLSAG